MMAQASRNVTPASRSHLTAQVCSLQCICFRAFHQPRHVRIFDAAQCLGRRELTATDKLNPASSQPPTSSASGKMASCSTELVDMVMLVNPAARSGAKDLVWLSWNAWKTGRQQAPSYGSQLIALTADGARKVKDSWRDWFPKTRALGRGFEEGGGGEPRQSKRAHSRFCIPFLGSL